MTAAEDVFEKSEKYFNRPPRRKNQGDDFRRDVEKVGRDPQNAITIHATRTAAILAAAGVRIGANADDTDGVIRAAVGLAVGERHDPRR